MKKISILIICIMLTLPILPFAVSAGDEENPEIEDPEDDVLLFGIYRLPILGKFFKNFDIISAWFHENSDEPNILYITMKVKRYKPPNQMAFYSIFWYYNNTQFAAVIITIRGEDTYTGIQIDENTYIPVEDFYTINEGENKITFAIPKDIIGDPKPGETLSNPNALGGIRFISDNLSNLLMRLFGTNILAVDFTNYGIDYTIEL